MLTRGPTFDFVSRFFSKNLVTIKVKSLLFCLAALIALPIIFSPLTADDIPNFKFRANLLSLPGNIVENWLISIWNLTNQWLEVEGRFFPGALIYGHIIHFIFQGIGLYKVFLASLLIGITFQIYNLMNYVFSKKASLIGVVFFLSSYSIRYVYFHDGITSFSGMVPFGLLCFLLSINIALRIKSFYSIKTLISILLYVFACLTYEHFAILVIGVFTFLALLQKENITLKYVLLTISIIQIVLALYLKIGQTTAPAYSINFSPLPVINTTLKQFLGAFPGSQYWATNNFISTTLMSQIMKSFTLVIIFAIVIYLILERSLKYPMNKTVTKRSSIAYLVLGFMMAVLPALLTGLTAQWQSSIPLGQAYLCVTIQSAGLSLILIVIYEQLYKTRAYLANLLALVTCALFVLNVFWNYFFIKQ